MNLLMESETVCVCGHHNPAVNAITARVRKDSLVTTGPSFGGVARFCQECKAEMPDEWPTRWRLIPEDQARVDAYRAKRFKDVP